MATVTLVGTEEVTRAASRIHDAAEKIADSASRIEFVGNRFLIAFEGLVARLEGAMRASETTLSGESQQLSLPQPSKRTATAARRQRVAELFRAGMPLHKIIETLGISMWTVRDDLRLLGVERIPRVYTKVAHRRDSVMEMYDANAGTPAEIALALGITEATVIDDIGVRLAERALAGRNGNSASEATT